MNNSIKFKKKNSVTADQHFYWLNISVHDGKWSINIYLPVKTPETPLDLPLSLKWSMKWIYHEQWEKEQLHK